MRSTKKGVSSFPRPLGHAGGDQWHLNLALDLPWCGYKILLPTAVCWHAISRAAHVQVIWPGAPWVWISSALPPRLGPATAGIHDEWRLNCPLTGLIFECCWESLTLSCIKGGGPPSPMYSRTQVRPYIILWCYMWSVDWRGQTAS